MSSGTDVHQGGIRIPFISDAQDDQQTFYQYLASVRDPDILFDADDLMFSPVNNRIPSRLEREGLFYENPANRNDPRRRRWMRQYGTSFPDVMRQTGRGIRKNKGKAALAAALMTYFSSRVPGSKTNPPGPAPPFTPPKPPRPSKRDSDDGGGGVIDDMFSKKMRRGRGRKGRKHGRTGRRRALRRRSGRGRKGGNKAVTFQHDAVNTYRSKRLSRGKKRMYRRTEAMFSTQIANNQVKRTYTVELTSTQGVQAYSPMPGLFSLYGSDQWDDLAQIFQHFIMRPLDNTATVANMPGSGAVRFGNKMMFDKGYMEMDMCNNGTTPCVVEIYSCIFRGKNISGASPADDLVFPGAAPTGTTAETTMQTQYVTPFDVAGFCQQWKIMGCKKIYLDVGKATDLATVARGFECKGSIFNDITANGDCALRGRTKFWFIVATGAPVSVTGEVGFSPVKLDITIQRTYNFKVIPVTSNVSVSL